MKRIFAISKFSFALIFTAAATASFAETGDAPVAQQQNIEQSEKELSRAFLRAAFTMRARRWPEGDAVRVFVYNQQHIAHQLLCKKILNMYPYQLKRSWDRIVYSGTGQAPIEVANEMEMREKVAKTPGAIGYVLTGGASNDVTVITHK